MKDFFSNYRTILEIRSSAIKKNVQQIFSIAKDKRVLAVLKANAYGLGVQQILPILEKQGIHDFLVATEKEALEVSNLTSKNIYLVGFALVSYARELISKNVIFLEGDLEKIQLLNEEAKKLNKRVKIHLCIDTGMGRLGVTFEETAKAVEKIESFSSISLEALYSHFASAGSDSSYRNMQLSRMLALREKFPQYFLHVSNSLGTLCLSNFPGHFIRPGLLLYGYTEILPPKDKGFSFEEAVSFKTHLSWVRRLKKGDSISYNSSYTLSEDANIGTLPVGYADGYPLFLSNKAFVSINGKKYPVVGRITMDYTMINLGNDEPPKNSSVELFGAKSMSFLEVATMGNTHTYALLCGISPRVKRLYI